jgi:anti-sigma regulatory factor (Ser/Thr protein kinase)
VAVSSSQPGQKARPPALPESLALVDEEFHRGDLYRIRAAVGAQAAHAGADSTLVDKLVLVASELVVNAVSHGGGQGRICLWRISSTFYCQVTDSGPGMPDPTAAGSITPVPGARGPRGLWVVRTVAEAVDIASSPRGTTVTVCFKRT